jgi:membrane protein
MAHGQDLGVWKLGGLSVRDLATRVWDEYNRDEVSDRAAALSYYFLFALFPALLFLVALLSYLPLQGVQERLLAYATDMMPPAAALTLEKTLGEVVNARRGGLLSLGVLATLWASSNGMSSVMSTLNAVWGVREVRAWWKRRLLAVLLTIGFSFFVIAAMVLIVFGPKIGGLVAGWFGLGDVFTVLWNVASIPIVIACALVGIQLVYYLAPARARHWHWLTPGAAVALVAWLAMSFGLRLYVNHFGNYSATYGSIGGVILLMLWLYLSSVVFLVGAEIDSEIEAAATRATKPSPVRAAA